MIIVVNSQINSVIQRPLQKHTGQFLKIYNGKKIPLIPPILFSTLISNFKENVNHFNDFFTSQCTPTSNDIALPSRTNSVSNVSLSSIQFKDQDILKIIDSLNYNKAHGHDDISIRLLKICVSSIVKSQSIFKIVYKLRLFLRTGKSQMVYLSMKKVKINF